MQWRPWHGRLFPRDASFTGYDPAIQYAGALFMMMSSVTFILYVRIFQGNLRGFFGDPQLRGFLSIAMIAVWSVTLWRTLTWDQGIEAAFRESWFNLASIFSGSGFFAGSFGGWEAPASWWPSRWASAGAARGPPRAGCRCSGCN